VNRSRLTRFSVAAVATAALLSGCSLHPGTAAVVGSDSISDEQVDAVAAALCSANTTGAQPGAQPVASRGARQGALSVLIESELSRQFGAAKGVEPSKAKVSAALAQNQAHIEALPADEREAFQAALKEYAEGQLMVIAAGRESLESQGKTNVTDDKALAEGMRLRAEYADGVDIDVDPRYGTFTDKGLMPGDSSLSVPVTDQAADGASPDPSAGWVAALPVSQTCA
jgi:hypothetical protein